MDKFISAFRKKVRRKGIGIAVVGLGYVGLPLAVEFARRGFAVSGIEIDKDRLRHIKKRESYISDVPTRALRQVLDSGRFSAGGSFGVLKDIDVIIICVPTPLKRKYHPDISYIRQAVRSIAANIKKGALVILESTTYPGTTDEVIRPILESRGLECGSDFYLAFSPERIDPGNAEYPVHKIPKIVGGVTPEATELTRAVYGMIIKKVVPVSSAKVAEVAKLLENTFRLINIGLIDELAMMAKQMNIDIWEVIEAAKTKPFGFMPFYPGPGVGGHCLEQNETIFVKDGSSLKAMRISDFIGHLGSSEEKDVEVLSFDPIRRRAVFRKVTAASARPYSGNLVDIASEDGRHIKVTELHPMFIYNGGAWQLKYARDLQKGDCLPICMDLPRFSGEDTPAEIDIIDRIRDNGRHLIDRIRVKAIGFSWGDYAKEIKDILREECRNKIPDAYWDYVSHNALPLKYFYMLKMAPDIDRAKIRLVTGRGPGYSEMPAKITLDKDFCRLIGYYLSEGCYTKDKSCRIRFSFNRAEKEYISDVVNILRNLGVRSSIYESKIWRSSCIKVSSNIFGFLIYEILGCGSNCYNMSIPKELFALGMQEKKALLSGVFRGDACVEHFFGKWRYRKNHKEYLHNVNTANISFFTSSRKLFHQLVILLHDLGIVPTFKRRKYALSIFGYNQLKFFEDIFEGKKKEIIAKYLELNKKRAHNKTFRKEEGFVTVKVRGLSFVKNDTGMVYSIETAKPHSFVTSYGIAVHNCIPKDPLYLYWKAKHHGFRSRFIKLASDIITYMPEYVVERVIELLKKNGKDPGKAKVLVIGVTYKKDIKDLRKSPPLDIIDIFQKKGIGVSYYDPIIPYLKFNHTDLRSVKLNKRRLSSFDCAIIATDHTCLDYKFILNNSRIVFDTRNVYKNLKDKRVVRL